ncbi:MAG: hypothetical protein SFV23_01045 [Planctomycetaceae bacterium]|nr:hypothetical protein [Planctomycetaceae bacterium]
MLEFRQPYYFVQDDVMVTDFPLLLWSCRSVWRGEIPEYVPFICLGGPWLSQGRGGTYPPLYLSYAIARHVLGDEYATMDVSAALHLAVGYVVVYQLLRRRRVRASVAMLGALTFVLSGPVLLLGRSWFQFVAVTALVPWLTLTVDQLRERPVTWRWPLIFGLQLALLYHAGFPQLWFMASGFLGVQILGLMLTRAVAWSTLRWVVPALLLAAGAIFPLFEQQRALTREFPAEPALMANALADALSLWFPYPLHSGTRFDSYWGNPVDDPYLAHRLYFGCLMPCFAISAVWDLMLRWCRLVARRRATHVWTIGGLLAVWLLLADDGGLWTAVVSVLPAGMRNHPLRLLPWFVLFTVMAGSLSIERWLRTVRRSAIAAGVVTAIGCGLLLYHVHWARSALLTFEFQPYPSLPTELDHSLQTCRGDVATERMLSLFPAYRPSAIFPYGLPQSIAAAHGYIGVGGSDPILERQLHYKAAMSRIHEQPHDALHAYGVRWIVRPPAGPQNPIDSLFFPVLWSYLADLPATSVISVAASDVSETGQLTVCRLGAVNPLCFDVNARQSPIPVQARGDGLDIELPQTSSTRRLVVNFLYYPQFQADIDGASIAISADDWGRMNIDVPPNARSLRMRYRPAWLPGILAGAMMTFVGAVGVAWASYTLPMSSRHSRGALLPTQISRLLRTETLIAQIIRPLTTVALVTAGILLVQAQLPRAFFSLDVVILRLSGRIIAIPVWIPFGILVIGWAAAMRQLVRTSARQLEPTGFRDTSSTVLALFGRFANASSGSKIAVVAISSTILLLAALTLGLLEPETLRLTSYRNLAPPTAIIASVFVVCFLTLALEPLYRSSPVLANAATAWHCGPDRIRPIAMGFVVAALCLRTLPQHQPKMAVAFGVLSVALMLASKELTRRLAQKYFAGQETVS